MTDLKVKQQPQTPPTENHPETVSDVFRQLERGSLTTEDADKALEEIRRRKYSWMERHVSS